jgi:DNA-binding NarL/FixJ family response regulator
MSIRILLVDDHQMIRQGLRALLLKETAMTVVGEAQDGRTAVKLAAELSPDVVVMDLRMPDLNGIDATRQLIAQQPSVKVIGLSSSNEERLAGEMLRAGASGYILKDSAFEELATAIRTVMHNDVYLSPTVASVVVGDYVRGGATGDGEDRSSVFTVLSSREREVLQLTAEGKAIKEVAACLHVSIKTVETHRRNIMEKLDVHSVAELTKYAIRAGITSL